MIIGVTGYKGAGKDTVADILVEHYGFDKISFAYKGKVALCETFGITMEQLDKLKNDNEASIGLVGRDIENRGFTFREFLQRWFNDGMKTAFGEMFWVEQLLHSNFQHAGFKYVIADHRFPLEAMRIKELDGYIVRVTRPGTEPDGHKSEIPLADEFVDFTIENDGTLVYLKSQVDALIIDIAEIEEKRYNATT